MMPLGKKKMSLGPRPAASSFQQCGGVKPRLCARGRRFNPSYSVSTFASCEGTSATQRCVAATAAADFGNVSSFFQLLIGTPDERIGISPGNAEYVVLPFWPAESCRENTTVFSNR